MKNVRFTVIVTSFNIENYIERAIDSVLNQKFENFQLIIADDCSTDKTMDKIRQYKDERISVYKTKTNSGTASGPRNLALKYAKGEYIIFLDGDDEMYSSNTLMLIDGIIAENKPDIVFLGYQDVGNGDKYRLSTEEYSTKAARLMCDVSFSVSSKCWNRKFLENNDIKFVEGMYYEDQVFSLKATVLSNETIFGEFPIFKYYRNRKDSVMTTPSIKKCSDLYRVMAEITDLYEITPDEYKKYLLSFIKNENDSIPTRIAVNISALEGKEDVVVLPKRNYPYVDFK